MITPLGRALRLLRMERNMMLKEMADGLKVSSAFLSAIETGKKPVPPDFLPRVSAWLKLDDDEVSTLRRALDQSVKEVKLKLPDGMEDADRETASILARQFSSLTSDDFVELREILNRRRA